MAALVTYAPDVKLFPQIAPESARSLNNVVDPGFVVDPVHNRPPINRITRIHHDNRPVGITRYTFRLIPLKDHGHSASVTGNTEAWPKFATVQRSLIARIAPSRPPATIPGRPGSWSSRAAAPSTPPILSGTWLS